jgi:hypothetical protein
MGVAVASDQRKQNKILELPQKEDQPFKKSRISQAMDACCEYDRLDWLFKPKKDICHGHQIIPYHGGALCRENTGLIYYYDTSNKKRRLTDPLALSHNLMNIFSACKFDIVIASYMIV